MKVLIACADYEVVEEIKDFLLKLCGVAADEISVVANLQYFRSTFLENCETLRLVFLEKDLPTYGDPSDRASLVAEQIAETSWAATGLLVATSLEDMSFLPGTRTYFGYDQMQSLTYNFRQYLGRSPH